MIDDDFHESVYKSEIQQFRLNVLRINKHMVQMQRIYGAGYSSSSRGPTQEERQAAEQSWDQALCELKECVVSLFRDVGGEEAMAVFQETVSQIYNKWGYGWVVSCTMLNRDIDFLTEVLLRCSSQPTEVSKSLTECTEKTRLALFKSAENK